MTKKTFFSLVSIAVLALLAFGIVSFLNKRYVEYKDPNLTIEEKKIYEDRVKNAQDNLKAIESKDDADAVEQRFNTYMELGHNYFGLGKYKEAKDAYITASKLRGGNHVVWGALHNIDLAREDYISAEKNIKTAIFLYPNNPDYWKWYIDLKRTKLRASSEELDKIFNEAFFKTNSHIDIMTAYAGFQEERGDLQTALNYWKQAQALEPDNTLIQQEIVRLEALLK